MMLSLCRRTTLTHLSPTPLSLSCSHRLVTVKQRNTVSLPATAYDMVVDATGRSLVSGGADKKLHVWAMRNGRWQRSYRPDAACMEINRVDMDPAGLMAATASFDRG